MDWELILLTAVVMFEFGYLIKSGDLTAAYLEKKFWDKEYEPPKHAAGRYLLSVFLGLLAAIPAGFSFGLSWAFIAMAAVSFVTYVGCRIWKDSLRRKAERNAPEASRAVKSKAKKTRQDEKQSPMAKPRPVRINSLGFLEDGDSVESGEDSDDDVKETAGKTADADLSSASKEASKDPPKESGSEDAGNLQQQETVHGPDEWCCSACGTWNRGFLCECGKTKLGIMLPENVKRRATWRCKCGRQNPNSVSECECGLFRTVKDPIIRKKKKVSEEKKGPSRWDQIMAIRQKELEVQMGSADIPEEQDGEAVSEAEQNAEAILEEELKALSSKPEQTIKGLQ